MVTMLYILILTLSQLKDSFAKMREKGIGKNPTQVRGYLDSLSNVNFFIGESLIGQKALHQ
jgi:hypothetical protein